MSKFKVGDKVIVTSAFDRQYQTAKVEDVFENSVRVSYEIDGITDSYHDEHLQLKSEYDMQNKTEVKRIPFDLERAKRGDKVINGKGQDVRIICIDRISKFEDVPILALHKEIDQEFCRAHSIDGRFLNTEGADDLHLFMAPVEKTEWIAVIKHTETGVSFRGSISAATEEELIRKYEASIYTIVCTKQITWKD